MRRELIVTAVLLVVAALAFSPVVGFDFLHYDDGLFTYENPAVRAGLTWDGVVYAFTSGEHALWAPMTFLSHMADAELFGFGEGAAGYHHLTNLALHLVNTAILLAFLWRATGAPWRSALVAALFALHPLHVESVAWISERKTLVATFFGFACLLVHARYARRPTAARYAAVAGLLALGLMSKAMLVTWPFVLLLCDWWPLGRLAPRDGEPLLERLKGPVLEKLPLIALSAAMSVITFRVQESRAMGLMDDLSLGTRVQNAAASVFAYVAQTAWPSELAVFYPYPPEIPGGPMIAGFALVGVGTAGALVLARSRPWAAVGWFWFVGTLVPMLQLVQVGNHSRADRYTYVPLVGLFVLVVWGVAELTRRVPKAARAAAAVAWLGALAVVSARQVERWESTESIFRHTVQVTEDNGFAENVLAKAVARDGRTAEAIPLFRDALRSLPRYVEAHENLGKALMAEGQVEEAQRTWLGALELAPERASLHDCLGGAFLAQGFTEDAALAFGQATTLEPRNPDYWYNLGIAHESRGRRAEALSAYERALALAPDHAPAAAKVRGLGGAGG